jgi:hypothetical protein
MKAKINFRKKYAIGTGPEGLDFSMQETPVQETPAQKAAREAREARIAERAKLVAIQKAKNAARLAPIEAAQQRRYENWRDSSEDNANKTYDDWQEELKDAQKGPDVPQEGLEIGKAKKGYKTKGSCTIDTKIERVRLAAGTGQDGIMKTKMNPRKKYANGSSASGMDNSNYIVSPAEALNDYNIMLAKVEQEAASNPWLPIVAMAGQAMQTGIGIAGGAASAKAATGVNDPNSPNYKPKKTAAMGMNDVEQDVEVEGGEMYETPQGEVGEFQGPSHEEGGIPLEVGEDVQEGTKVYSDRLKVGNKTLAERKETRERQIANLEKIASQPLVDQAIKNATQRKMMAIEREEAADLDFQEKVNNMQTMADTMVAAFGTGMAGLQDNPIGDSMRYGYGTSSKGVMKYRVGGTIGDPWKYIQGDANLNGIVDTEENPANRLLNANKALEDYLNSDQHKKADTALDSVINKTEADTKAMVQTGTLPSAEPLAVTTLPGSTSKTTSPIVNTGKTGAPGFVDGFGMDVDQTEEGMASPQAGSSFKFNPIEIPALDLKVPNVADNAMNSLKTEDPFAMTAGEDWKKETDEINKAAGIPESIPGGIDFKSDFFPGGFGTGTEAGTGTAKEAGKKGPSGFMKALSGSIPGVGDLTKMVGNYLGMTAGIKTAAEQRSTDITHTNVYKNAGKESQKLLDNAKQGIETSKAQAIVKATDVSRGGKRGGRNSARGVNQMRAMDWLYDSALQQQVADISAKAAEQMSGIDVQKSSVAMNADQLKGQGEYQAAMANEAAKDAYYTALGQGRKDFATGLQQTGKDLNAMKENKIIENLMKNYGKWVGASNTGELMNKAGITQDSKTKQYKDASGKILTEEEVQAALLKVNK